MYFSKKMSKRSMLALLYGSMLLSKADLASLLGVSRLVLEYWISTGRIEAPSHDNYFTEGQWLRIKNRKTGPDGIPEDLVSVSKAALLCNRSWSTFRTAVKAGLIPAPHVVFGRRQYYERCQIEGLKATLDNTGNAKPNEVMLKKGYYSILAASRYLGMPHITFQSWLNAGQISRPTNQVGLKKYYSLGDLEAIRQQKKEYFDERTSTSPANRRDTSRS